LKAVSGKKMKICMLIREVTTIVGKVTGMVFFLKV